MLSSFFHHLRPDSDVRSSIGSRGESLAARHLKRGGYRILARNVRNRFGEIDLVARTPDGRTIVIVEVKTSQGVCATGGLPANAENQRPSPWRPEVHVTADKQRRLTALAVQYVRRYRLHDHPIRFDVIGIDLPGEPASSGGRWRNRFRKPKPVIRHHVGAFESRV